MSTLQDEKTGQHWLIRYKLYHIPFWFLYNYLWWVVATGNPMKAADALFSPLGVKFIFYVLFQAMAVYFNLYYLMPRYLDQKRYGLYVTYLCITVTATALCIVGGYYAGSIITGYSLKALYGNGSNCFYYFLGYALPAAVASMTFAMTIKLAKKWMQSANRQQQLEKAQLETELKFLKHQFNPHFLFNTINSIFVLIRKNPDKASDSLASFSELLSYQLYECNGKEIALSQETNYLENFIELEKLRQESHVQLSVEIDKSQLDDLNVAPFILIPFVENAFKHVSADEQLPGWIKINLRADRQQIYFSVINSSTSGETASLQPGGIGLENVKRRLELLYPDQYELTINKDNGTFEVSLKLTLNSYQSALTRSESIVNEWSLA